MFLVSYIFYVVRYVFVWYLFFLSLSSHFILSDFVANKRTYIWGLSMLEIGYPITTLH